MLRLGSTAGDCLLLTQEHLQLCKQPKNIRQVMQSHAEQANIDRTALHSGSGNMQNKRNICLHVTAQKP